MSRFQQLQRLLGKQVEVEPEEGSMFDTTLDYLGRPNAAIKSGIHAYQQGEPVLDAMSRGFTSPSDQAPTGDQIASKFGESTGIENPMALAALSTLAEMADVPTVGPLSKGAKAMKAVSKVPPSAVKKVPGFAKTGESAAEALQKAKPSEFGKVAVTTDRAQPGLSRQTLQDRVGREDYDKIIKRFPHLRDAMTAPN